MGETLEFNGAHLVICAVALFLGFVLGMAFGYIRGEERGRGEVEVNGGLTRCPSCGAWHSGKVCEPCKRKGQTEWTVRTNQMRKPKWWR